MEKEVKEIFSRALIDAFRKILMLDLHKTDLKEDVSRDISAIIDLTGDLTGSISLSMSKETAGSVVSGFIGEPVTNLNEIEDGVGELANMIAGNAKSEFEDKEISISLPRIFANELAKGDDTITLAYTCDSGEVLLTVSLNN